MGVGGYRKEAAATLDVYMQVDAVGLRFASMFASRLRERSRHLTKPGTAKPFGQTTLFGLSPKEIRMQKINGQCQSVGYNGKLSKVIHSCINHFQR